ncbi:MAG: hypothetical protein ACKVIQ_09150 [Acidimicrobiales bacterium]
MSSPEQLVAPQANAVRDVIEPGTVYQMLVSLKEDAQTTTRVIATHCEELLDRYRSEPTDTGFCTLGAAVTAHASLTGRPGRWV